MHLVLATLKLFQIQKNSLRPFSVCRSRFSSTMDSFSKFQLYRNVDEILDDLSQHDAIEPVQELLKIYNNKKECCDEEKREAQHPLIIFEGLDGSGKTSMTKVVARKSKAERWLTPPESIRFLREYFDGNPSLRTAYYSLGNYIAALEVACILHDKPVFMDRFWHSTTAYALAQAVANNPGKLQLPPASDDIYKWPSDLLKPDKIILLSVSEAVRLERHSRRGADMVTAQEKLLKDDTKFREDVIQAYKNMREPGVSLVDGDGSFGKTRFLLLDMVKPLLKE